MTERLSLHFMETVKRSMVGRGCDEGGMNRQSTEDVKGNKIFCMIL